MQECLKQYGESPVINTQLSHSNNDFMRGKQIQITNELSS